MKKIEVPLYKKLDKRGRPVKYDFSEFLNPKTKFIMLAYQAEHYNSIRSTLTRWKKIFGIKGRFRFDFHFKSSSQPSHWIIWKK